MRGFTTGSEIIRQPCWSYRRPLNTRYPRLPVKYSAMKITVIISAHKKRREMEFVLAGYAAQQRPADEIIVSQDGQFPEIAEAVAHSAHFGLPIMHLTQQHRGFGKCRALNQAILQASGDLLLFTDGDC